VPRASTIRPAARLRPAAGLDHPEADDLGSIAMTTIALRWSRRALDTLLVVAAAVVILAAGITMLAPLLGGRALVIGGGSMEPTIPQGALVLTLPSDTPYAVGDVVTVQHGAATPFTHRITRLTELDGVPYVETKGDANAEADPVIVPAAAIDGRVVVSIPLLGYVSALLATGLGLAAFLALGAGALLLAWILEDLEEERCPACAAAAGAADHADHPGGVRSPAAGIATVAMLDALPAFAAPGARARIRETGRARAAGTPVVLERDRRDPRRHGHVTVPQPAPNEALEAADDRADRAA
jgi:signal peptidase